MNVPQLSEAPPREVLAITLFGSAARGDFDDNSDVDIFLLVADVPFDKLLHLQEWCATAFRLPTQSVSAYSARTAAAMATSGALLLWHLRLEGRVLFQRDGAADSLLRSLTPFTAFTIELETFNGLVDDVAEAWIAGRGPTELDLHVLQLVVRNVCILVTVFFGTPTFGRMSAVERAKQLAPAVPVDLGIYRELCAWHLLFLRGHKSDTARRITSADKYLAMTRSVLAFARSLTC